MFKLPGMNAEATFRAGEREGVVYFLTFEARVAVGGWNAIW